MENNNEYNYNLLEDYLEENKTKKNHFKRFINKVLISLVIMIVSLIFVKISDKNKKYFKKYVFNTTFNFTSFNNFYEKYFGSIFHKDDTKMVFSENIDYLVYDKYLDGIKVSAVNQNVVSLKGGIVIFKGNKEGYNNTIIVQGSDGFDIWYGNLENINVNIYDYIDEGSIIGNCKENLYLVITKDNKYYTYEEYENISKN